jgi:hypothetical protein
MIPLELAGVVQSDETTAPVIALTLTTRNLGGFVGNPVSQLTPPYARARGTIESKFAFGLAVTSMAQ